MHMNVLDAAYNVGEDYKDGGTAGLARRIGRNPTTLTHELTRTGTAKLGLADAVKMSVLSRDLRVLHAYAASCGQMCVPLPESIDMQGDDVLKALADSSREFAELCQETCADMADGEISDNELARIDRERGELIAALHHLGEAIRARNLSGKSRRFGG